MKRRLNEVYVLTVDELKTAVRMYIEQVRDIELTDDPNYITVKPKYDFDHLLSGLEVKWSSIVEEGYEDEP